MLSRHQKFWRIQPSSAHTLAILATTTLHDTISSIRSLQPRPVLARGLHCYSVNLQRTGKPASMTACHRSATDLHNVLNLPKPAPSRQKRPSETPLELFVLHAELGGVADAITVACSLCLPLCRNLRASSRLRNAPES